MSICENLSGKRFNKLVVLRRAENNKNGSARWICKCDCGNITTVSAGNLKGNSVKSCGCLRHEAHNTHHLSNTKICKIWYGMRKRCYSEKEPAYKDYGGRGITICDEWLNDVVPFYKWAINNGYKDGLMIERIDNDKGYSPDNCKWATPKDQANNRRSCVNFTYNGETKNLTQWCNYFGLPYKTIHARIYKRHWTFERAITEPIKAHNIYG